MTKTRTTAERSATAKAAYARRQADKALGLPSISELSDDLSVTRTFASKAAARRAAVTTLAADRAKAAAPKARTTFQAAMAAGAARKMARRRDSLRSRLTQALNNDKPWRALNEARGEAARRVDLMDDRDVAGLSGTRNANLLAATYGL